jgi:hypothetical protein
VIVRAFKLVERSFYIPSDVAVEDARNGYLLAADDPTPPAEITLSDSLSMAGFYVFVPALPQGGDLATFIDEARAFLTSTAPPATRFAWFPDPTASGSELRAATLQVAVSGGVYTTVDSLFLEIAPDLSLRVDGGDAITLDGDSGLVFTPPAGTDNALYVSPEGTSAQILPLSTPLGLTLLGGGAVDGCFRFQIVIGGDWLAYLDVGLRTFYRDPFWGLVESFRYRLFDEADPSFTLYATLDPLAALDPARACFAFTDPAGAAAPAPLTTYYRTNLGHAVALTPGATSRLVFAPRSDVVRTLYLVPSGDFLASAMAAGAAAAAASGQTASLMCGLSGVEYVGLETDGAGAPATRLSFSPGMPAFAEGFDAADPGNQGVLALTGEMTTSWAYADHAPAAGDPGSIVYHAQPDESVLYKPGIPAPAARRASRAPGVAADPIAVVDEALVYMEVPSLYLPAKTAGAAAGATAAFPMLPYGGAEGDPRAIGILERKLVSPVRKDAIAAIVKASPAKAPRRFAALAPDEDPRTGVTPQGLLAEYSSDYAALAKVLLARTEPAEGSSDDSFVSLEAVARDSDLWIALQSNQLFLVVTDPAALTPHLRGALRVQGWELDLDPSRWRPDTVLIFKFFGNAALRDLASDPDVWTMPRQFNVSVPAAAAAIEASIRYAIDRCCGAGGDCLQSGACPGSPDFAFFIYQVLLNPLWNGVLALNVPVPPTALPKELAGLAAGIDESLFFAHHAGVDATPVDHDAATGTLTMKRSSVFGLVSYSDPERLASTSDYAFKVRTLEVLFQSSAIASFASRVELQINKLFGDEVFLRDGAFNNVVFDGVYQDHDGEPSYVFANQAENRFSTVDSQVIDSVTLEEGQLVTSATSAADGRLETQFVFWGILDFKALPGLDVFSFGSDGDGDGEGGLAFSNLAIRMRYDPAAPAAQSFLFDVAGIAFDLARSRARATSLYAHFPLKLMALTSAATSAHPVDAGYMSVTSPLAQGTLSVPWYGLAFELELGSLGALAEQSGFVAGFVAAWSPSRGGDHDVFLGLALPGSSGNKREITLQGPLKIKIKSLQLTAAPGDAPGSVAYMLRLQTITLSFMGLPLPPSGRTDFLLFGDPGAAQGNKTLGWYAVYDKGVKPRPLPPVPIPGFTTGPAPRRGQG